MASTGLWKKVLSKKPIGAADTGVKKRLDFERRNQVSWGMKNKEKMKAGFSHKAENAKPDIF